MVFHTQDILERNLISVDGSAIESLDNTLSIQGSPKGYNIYGLTVLRVKQKR